VQQQTKVAKDLELLADFILHVSIVGMKFFKLALESIDVSGCECVGRDASPRRPRTARASRPYLRNTSHDVQHVQGPAALGDGYVFQRFDALESFADFGCRGNLAFGDDGDAGFGSNTPCSNIKNRFRLEQVLHCS